MPNWCENTISISGNAGSIKNLKEFVGRPIDRQDEKIEEPIYSLANIMPSTPDAPPILGEASKSTGHEDWYHNNISEEGGELCHTAWTRLGMDCYQCEQYENEPDEYEEYLYDDCPPAIELAKKTGVVSV